MQIVRLFTL